MQTRITARHFSLNDELREHVESRVSRLEHFYDGITDASAILSIDKGHPDKHEAEIVLSVYRQRLTAHDMASTHKEAIDKCTARLRRQLLKYKAKLRNHR